MFGIQYMKAAPTTYVMYHRDGRVRRAGAGISFTYFAPTATIVAVPLASMDIPFVWNAVTADFQTVTVQGQFSYRVTDAQQVAALLDYSVDPDGDYRSEDPARLDERLVLAAQELAGGVVQRLTLRQTLVNARDIATEVLAALRRSEPVTMLGLEILDLTIVAIRPTPEMAKALEAEAREAIARAADEAIYARRNAAVVEERKIKESELETERSVEEKRLQIREAQMAGEITVEEQRRALVDTQVENDRKEAEGRAYALESMLTPLRDVDWRTLLAASGGGDARLNIAVAFRELAEHAERIGSLNITPDLLDSLVDGK
jgi:regulator of protease activity HflC (stomatin/prohibitin superfamily)